MLVERYLTRQLRTLPPPFEVAIKDKDMLLQLARCTQLIIVGSAILHQADPILAQIYPVQDQTEDTRQLALQIAGSLTASSRIPVFRAIRTAAENSGLPLREIEVDPIHEEGLLGKLDRTWYILGDTQCMQAEGVELGVTSLTLAAQLEVEGLEARFLAQKQPKRLLALLVIRTVIAEEICQAIKAVDQLGISLSLIADEKPMLAQAIAQQLRVTLLGSQLLPEEKRTILTEIYDQNPATAFLVSRNQRRTVPQGGLVISMGEYPTSSSGIVTSNWKELASLIEETREILRRTKRRFFWCKL